MARGIRNGLRRAVLAVLAVLLVAAGAAGAADEAKMTYVEYQLVAFGLAPESFMAQPKKLWRVGDSHLRLEEAVNRETNEQRLIVVAQPDIWVIERISKRGRHERDPGPTYKVRFPVFAGDPNDELTKLEMGSEVEYFRERGAKDVGEKTIAGVTCNESATEVGGRKLSLFTRKADGVPFQVVLTVGEKAFAIRYLRFERGLAVDKSLFVPPAGVTIEEAPKAEPAPAPAPAPAPK
ncbi:MAG: hypothetical protein K2Y35_13880 [Burkholderiales bacterium]|nr:hypothetical protein [Burkholderiales bacterium]